MCQGAIVVIDIWSVAKNTLAYMEKIKRCIW